MQEKNKITCSSFLRGEAVGTATLQVLNMLSDSSDPQLPEVYDMITYIILPSLRKVM
jgi:acetylglutamate synthase